MIDITDQVEQIVTRHSIQEGLVSVYVQGATAAIMIQENWDDSVQTDVINLYWPKPYPGMFGYTTLKMETATPTSRQESWGLPKLYR